MDYRYLISNKHNLVQYIATHLTSKGYHYYVTSWIPPDKDVELIDAKLITRYECYRSKFSTARKKKGGDASVKYVRSGRLCILMATKGRSRFFEDEKDCVKCVFDNPLVIGGYSISVNRQSLKTSVRIHREAQKKLKLFIMEWGSRRSLDWWLDWFRRFPFLAFAGVQDCQYALLRLLNETRKAFKQEPLDWKISIRRKFASKILLEPSSKELLDCLRAHQAALKSSGEAEKE